MTERGAERDSAGMTGDDERGYDGGSVSVRGRRQARTAPPPLRIQAVEQDFAEVAVFLHVAVRCGGLAQRED